MSENKNTPMQWEAPTINNISQNEYFGKLLLHFKELTPPKRLSNNLRNLIFHYQTLALDGHPFVMEDLLTDMLNLFDLLEKMDAA